MQLTNKIPEVVKNKNISLTTLHYKASPLSWPTVQKLSSQDNALRFIPDSTEILTLVLLAQALDCEVTDLFAVEV